jgi:energy-coupling factor transport system permease protein
MPWLDRINPFAKLAGAALLTACSWLAGDSLLAGALTTAFVLALVLASRIPHVLGFFKMMGLVGMLVTVSWTMNFLLRGVPFPSAVARAICLALRIVATTGSFFIAVETTSAGVLTATCSRYRIPPRATLFLVLIVGVIPLLREEFRLIGETQRARGLELDRGPIWRRALYALARGVPLMVQTYRMAEAISLGMSLHGFDLKARRTTWRDVGWLTVDSSFPAPKAAR